MSVNIQYFVNPKSRLCQMISGHPQNPYHIENINSAIRDGFMEVSLDEMEEFRAKTSAAIKAGWNPDGRMRYDTFMKRLGQQ